MVLWGLVFAVVAAVGYGLAWSLPVVLVLLVIHAPEGLVHPVLTAILSRAVPEDAQGQLQGGVSSVSNLAMLFGTLFFSQVFAVMTAQGAPPERAGWPFLVAALILLIVLVLFALVLRARSRADPALGG